MQAFPLSDGLWVSDVATGKGRLVVSLAQLREVTTTGEREHPMPCFARRLCCFSSKLALVQSHYIRPSAGRRMCMKLLHKDPARMTRKV